MYGRLMQRNNEYVSYILIFGCQINYKMETNN